MSYEFLLDGGDAMIMRCGDGVDGVSVGGCKRRLPDDDG